MSRPQEEIMNADGYVTASAAAEAIGASQVGTIHRMVKAQRLLGARAGLHWYVSVASLLAAHADAPPLLKRITALGVEANKEHENKINTDGSVKLPAIKKAPAHGKSRSRRTSSA